MLWSINILRSTLLRLGSEASNSTSVVHQSSGRGSYWLSHGSVKVYPGRWAVVTMYLSGLIPLLGFRNLSLSLSVSRNTWRILILPLCLKHIIPCLDRIGIGTLLRISVLLVTRNWYGILSWGAWKLEVFALILSLILSNGNITNMMAL